MPEKRVAQVLATWVALPQDVFPDHPPQHICHARVALASRNDYGRVALAD